MRLNLLERYLARSRHFPGVGPATARRLVSSLEGSLPELLDAGDVEPLAALIGSARAIRVANGWEADRPRRQLAVWLDEHNLPPRIATSAVGVWGDRAASVVRANPFVLLTFAPWAMVDAIARTAGIRRDSPVRLVAAVEAALYEQLDQGSTAVLHDKLRHRVAALLHCTPRTAEQAIRRAEDDGAAIAVGPVWQAVGAHVMERYVAERLVALCDLSPLAGGEEAQAVAHQVEVEFTRQVGFPIHDAQRSALIKVLTGGGVTVVTGAAGTGKTAFLLALVSAINKLRLRCHAAALAGRAARRITELAGVPASTLAALSNAAERSPGILPGDVVIIDEASMVDLPTMYRVLRKMPADSRLVLLGDAGQLPPIGFGLIFHALVDDQRFRPTQLTQIHRQATTSNIPSIANSVTAGRVPMLDPYQGAAGGVFLLHSDSPNVDARSLETYRALGGAGSVQLLSTRKNGPCGAHTLNAAIHSAVSGRNARFVEGEPVMWTKNDWQLELMNGSLGHVVHAETNATVVQFDERVHKVRSSNYDRLTLAYAITVHKAQGSEFGRVVIPLDPTFQGDRSLLYTAMTRAVEQVVIVGSHSDLEAWSRREARWRSRVVGLPLLLSAYTKT